MPRLRFCNPGRFNRKVTVLQKTVVQDDTGQPVETWATMTTMYAEKRDLRASERFRAEQELATSTTLFETHFRQDITPGGHRLEHDGTVYDIESIAELGFRERIEIVGTAVV